MVMMMMMIQVYIGTGISDRECNRIQQADRVLDHAYPRVMQCINLLVHDDPRVPAIRRPDLPRTTVGCLDAYAGRFVF